MSVLKSWTALSNFRGSNCANPKSSAFAGGTKLTIHKAFDGNGKPTCYPDKTFDDAALLCSRAVANGRLCTSPEIEDGVTTGTGCNYDSERIWTSTSCGDGKHITKLGRGGGKCGINKMKSKEMCSKDSYVAGGVRCCADTIRPLATTVATINAGDKTVQLDDVSGINNGDRMTVSDSTNSETRSVQKVNNKDSRSRRADTGPGTIEVTESFEFAYKKGTKVSFSSPPSFVWGSMRGCCRAVGGKTRYNPYVAATQAFLDSTPIAEATTNCTATCAVDEACTAVEVSKKGKNYPARCEFFTNTQISSSSRATKSCKKAKCIVKKDYVAPTATPVAGPPPSPLIQTSAPTATPTSLPAWNELRGCCREFTAKQEFSHQNTATTVALVESSATAAATACKKRCSEDGTCTAAEVRGQKKKKKTTFKCELHTATGINSSTRRSQSCKKATCSIKN